jgi:hypothetical protein
MKDMKILSVYGKLIHFYDNFYIHNMTLLGATFKEINWMLVQKLCNRILVFGEAHEKLHNSISSHDENLRLL